MTPADQLAKLILEADLPARLMNENERLRMSWKRAERQISAELKRHGLELHMDPYGNYSIAPH